MNFDNISIDWEQFFNNSIDAMLITDGDGSVLAANAGASEYMSMTVEEIIGTNVHELLAKNVYQNSTILKAVEEKRVVTDIVLHKNLRLLSTSIPLLSAFGEVEYVITNTRSHSLIESLYKQITAYEEKNLKYQEIISRLNDSNAGTIIAKSSEMLDVIKYCDDIAQYDGNVMLTGESGCGKDLIARYIHSKSNRSSGSFLPINCAAIPRELFESECFGYSKGAFTGALNNGKTGFFELANGGTIFLDEIGELPLDMQSKLLRVTETGEFSPVGSTKIIKTDVRIISATNRDLEAMKESRSFREDLFYRLSVIPIFIPPLRERIDDIEAISQYYIDNLNKKYGAKKHLSELSLQALKNYNWPGNIRELKNVIERWYIITSGSIIEIDFNNLSHKSHADIHSEDSMPADTHRNACLKDYTGTLVEATKEFQNDYIRYVLNKNNNRIGDASKELGIHRSTLYRKKY